MNNLHFSHKLRTESSKQFSGKVNMNKIPLLKEKDYYIKEIPLIGDAPKQYIKAYFYKKSCPRHSRPNTWHGYYAKTGGKSYPHESIVEYAINKVGDALNLNMNKTKLVRVNSQVRFLSQDFIGKGKRLIHGTEILSEYFEDSAFVDQVNKNRNLRREYFTFNVVEDSIKHVYPKWSSNIINELIKMITFDAIVGNRDRHFYNWGVIGDTLRNVPSSITFAPIYDSARALFWNSTESKILQIHKRHQKDPLEIEAYLKKSEPRFSFEENPRANHFDLIEFLVSYEKDYGSIIQDLTTLYYQNQAVNALKSTLHGLFSVERTELMVRVLELRFEKIRQLVNDL